VSLLDADFMTPLLAAPRRNVELKAQDPSPARTFAACLKLPVEDRGELWQRDTYFAVARGRLKLREQRPGADQLIQYDRKTARQERESRYEIAEIDDAEGLRAVLTAALGIGVVVIKRRRLLLWQTVRIHLDAVESLGSFIELEAVAEPNSDLQLEYRLIARLRESLRITDDQLVATGYAEQLLDSDTPQPPTPIQPDGPRRTTGLGDCLAMGSKADQLSFPG
jgi:predicted adenylyl cyclase CyaB